MARQGTLLAQVLSSAPSLSTARGPVPCRGEPRVAGDSMCSRCLISWVWGCEDGARPAVEAFGPDSRCVANTADISIPAQHCQCWSRDGQRGTGSQQTMLKHCTQRLIPSQTQKERKKIIKKKKDKKDQRMLNSTERATHGEESCFQEPQG